MRIERFHRFVLIDNSSVQVWTRSTPDQYQAHHEEMYQLIRFATTSIMDAVAEGLAHLDYVESVVILDSNHLGGVKVSRAQRDDDRRWPHNGALTMTHADQTDHAKKPTHKMNHKWQKAADEAANMAAGWGPDGQAAAVAGIQNMYDAIANAEQTESARLDAAMVAFEQNTASLRQEIKGKGVPADVAAKVLDSLLQHTRDNLHGTILDSVKHGHKKD
jgi:hypothetical protein